MILFVYVSCPNSIDCSRLTPPPTSTTSSGKRKMTADSCDLIKLCVNVNLNVDRVDRSVFNKYACSQFVLLLKFVRNKI